MRWRHRGEMFDELIDVILLGWDAPWDPNDPMSDAFRVFEFQDRDLARVWTEHETRLRAEAGRRGLEPRWLDGPDGPYFYAEALARRLARGEVL